MMTRDEIIAAVTHQYAGGGEEEDDIIMVNRLRQALPHSTIGNLILHDFRGLTPEQVVAEAIRQEEDYLAANPKSHEMTRDEALLLANMIRFGPPLHSVISKIVAELHVQFPHADINDLLFHSPVKFTSE
jgi:acyl-CoA hydrolase